MKIIITRPIEDAVTLAAKLESLGHTVVIAPVLHIKARAAVDIPSRNYQALCVTSANGLRVLKAVDQLKNIPVLAVGPQSMQIALDRGFINVQAQGGDVDGLVAYCVATLDPAAGPILYVSGSQTSGDLEGKLRSAHFDVDRAISYDAVPASLVGFEAEIQSADAVLLYSPRSAKLWVSAINNLRLQDATSTLQYICLSNAIAASLPDHWAKQIAARPTEMALIAALDCAAKAE